MPEYGISDQSPEDLARSQTENESNETWRAVFKAAEAADRTERQRRAESELSSIKTAKLLVELSYKIDREHKERLDAEANAEKQRMHDAKISRFRFIIGTVIGLLTLMAAVYPYVRPYFFLG